MYTQEEIDEEAKAASRVHTGTDPFVLRDTLLPKLMSGELNVFDKPNDQS